MRKFYKIGIDFKEFKKKTYLEVKPEFLGTGKGLMRKGGKFYAVLDEETGMWSTDESDVIKFVDRATVKFADEHFQKNEKGDYIYFSSEEGKFVPVKLMLLDNSSSKLLLEFNKFCAGLPPNNNYVQLDTEITYADDKVTPNMYRSKRLSYNVAPGSIESYDKLISVLYSEQDREKIEWSIGAIFTGMSKKIEKILVLYGKPGSGKSTILDLIKLLFKGYWAPFVASELVSKTHQFATAAFKDNPLLAIQDDGSLAKIESPVINEIISHKDVMINEKGKQQYSIRSNSFLIMATNETVDIRDRKLGITRRLLDCYPSGRRIPEEEFDALSARMEFELGAIAYHCIEVFKKLGKNYYSHYEPIKMIEKTNPLQNFLFDKLEQLTAKKYYLRSELYALYKAYCDESGFLYPPKMTDFTEQIAEYYESFEKIKWIPEQGKTVRNVFSGLKVDKVCGVEKESPEKPVDNWLKFDMTESLYDKLYSEQPAQYPNEDGNPKTKWDFVKTKLKDLDTKKLHWVKLPDNVIRIDFDLKGPDGEKNLELNIKAASKFPPTYAEISKSGGGIHLYYIWDGDVNTLSSIYDENIEIKKPNQADRRILTRCNGIRVATISTGLPLKEVKPKIEDFKTNESSIRTTIKRCLAKEVHPDTTSNIDWIYEILERAYISNCSYDVSNMEKAIRDFASNSTNQSVRCLKKVDNMKFKSADRKILSKGGKPMVDAELVELENEIRNYIREKLANGKKNASETIDFLTDFLNRVYESGIPYDVGDMRQSILIFSVDNGKSDRDRDYCTSKISQMKFASENAQTRLDDKEEAPIVFFDCEVFPNLIVVCWKYAGPDHKVMKMINPTPEMIDGLCEAKLIGFNNKDYDNHILYAIKAGYTIKEVYNVSKGLINKEDNAKFREAKNLSYTDIFDFSSKKQSLKDWEIELGIHHQELGLPWDSPVDESLWETVADYCTNDVIATEALFYHLKQDWMARQILADLADSNVNESTNNLTLKIVFGKERKPLLVYTDLATGVQTVGR